MKVKAKSIQTIDVEIDRATAHDVTINYLEENPERLLNITKDIFLKKHKLPSDATYDATDGIWKTYEEWGSHYSGYIRTGKQPPKEETETFQEIVARLYVLFGTSLS